MHGVLSDDGKETSTTKGVNIAIEFNEYKIILVKIITIVIIIIIIITIIILINKMKRIQNEKHKFRKYEVNNISLSCFDDKRYILDYGVHTLAYFHKDLKRKKIL